MYEDRIFGDLLHPDRRLAGHRAGLSGVRHGHRIDPIIPVPNRPIRLALTAGGPVAFDAARCVYAIDGGGGGEIDLRSAGATWDTIEWGYVHCWSGELPALPAGSMVRYRLAARIAGSDEWVHADNQARDATQATEFAVWIDPNGVPAWAREAIVYHVFLDRFYPGDGKDWLQPDGPAGFFGGTLRGVIQKLDYIQSLGFNAIWMSPLFASPSHHGYDAVDYYQVEPRLGHHADLKELIDSAHARGLRVILDFVANHWSHLHATFQSARCDPSSPYRDWYVWKHWPDDYETYFGVRELPQLNLRRGPARDYLLDCARYWLKQGVDGYRLDYAYGPPHDFWTDFRRACRMANSDCWLFGEVINTASLQLTYGGRLDGTLDFLLARALRETFGHRTWPLSQFESFLAAHEAFFPPEFSCPSFLDNHDMNRFLYLSGGDAARLKLAALVLFTLSGPPVVYYGTEAGVTQERPIHQNDFGIFEEARLPMKWGDEQDADLREFFRRLVHLRREHSALRGGARRVVHLDDTAGTYAYRRGDALVALNTGAEPRTLRLPAGGLPKDAADRLNGQRVTRDGNWLDVHLAGQSGVFVA